jgi:hypothetical protein
VILLVRGCLGSSHFLTYPVVRKCCAYTAGERLSCAQGPCDETMWLVVVAVPPILS